ncbi:hypothetical protein B0H12DRAFT_1145552 [Mycena haematopus]|nr:hypothetical protein B0H12DRAFT_1145552 [Mycena haematopus]
MCLARVCHWSIPGQRRSTSIGEADAKYREYMNKLPYPEERPPLGKLGAVCRSSGTSLLDHLSQNPATRRFLNDILYLPKRLVTLSGFNYLAYGPTAWYDRAKDTWIEGSDLAGFHGATRELFVETQGSILYVGTYLCHDLRKLHPAGINTPRLILADTIMDAALGVPRPDDHLGIIKQRYPDGKIKVEVTGLQCVGFKMELYDALRHRFKDDRTKRTAGNSDLRDRGAQSNGKKRRIEG